MLDKYKEQILLTEMEKACLSLGPDAFLELVQETYSRCKLATEDQDDGQTEHMAFYQAAVECLILNLEDPAPEEYAEQEAFEFHPIDEQQETVIV